MTRARKSTAPRMFPVTVRLVVDSSASETAIIEEINHVLAVHRVYQYRIERCDPAQFVKEKS